MGNRRAGQHLRDLTRAAYTATAGHLEVDPSPEPVPLARRWAPSLRAAAVAAATLLLLGVVVAVWAWASRPPEAVPLPGPSSAADGQPGLEWSGAGEAPGGTEGPAAAGEGSSATAGPVGPAVDGEPSGAQPATAAPAGPGAAAPLIVHVAGAVHRPGVVELPAGARVVEAVTAAGGPTEDAELAAVNLARPVQDGEQVYLPRVGEAPPGAAGGPAADGAGAPAGPGAGGGPGPVDLNTATAEELDSLPGVGPAIAERILRWRAVNGPFTTVDDLDAVPGIGPATMARLRDLVMV